MTFVQAVFEEYWPSWQQVFTPSTRMGLGGAPLPGLAEITDFRLSEAAGRYLSADELVQWGGFSQKKRRVEWLGGRLAAKMASAKLLDEKEVDWKNLAVRTEKDGRPCLTAVAREAAPFISISHSGGLAAALAANCPCGLDIQLPGDRIHRVKERFAFQQEEDILNHSLPGSFTKTEHLTMLWATKEAMRKMVRASPLLGLLEIRLLAEHGGYGTPQDPLVLTFSPGREDIPCPPIISVLCFFADNLAWAMACLPPITKE